MTGETVNFEKAAAAVAVEDRNNERSSIGFPYADLDTAVEVAKALYARVGRGACELDGLAAQLNQTISGAFRLKTGAAKVFGLIDKEGRDAARLTDLGLKIISSDDERAARVDAFLAVPLYTAVYDRYKGNLLPPAKALEREMINLGVSPKVADRARQAFERSARQAAFFEAGENRLVKPRLEQATHSASAVELKSENINGQESSQDNRQKNGGSGGGGYHPLIEGLIKTLPEAETAWSTRDRVKWLKTAIGVFDLIYEGEDKDILVKVEDNAV
jgi:hypothetical protein